MAGKKYQCPRCLRGSRMFPAPPIKGIPGARVKCTCCGLSMPAEFVNAKEYLGEKPQSEVA